MLIHISAELKDSHLVELSTRITSQQELMNLGIKGLNLPRHTIQSALYNHRDSIQDAAYAVISDWVLQYETRSKAFATLVACLQKCKMRQLATELRLWVEGADSTQEISKESRYNFSKICVNRFIVTQQIDL